MSYDDHRRTERGERDVDNDKEKKSKRIKTGNKVQRIVEQIRGKYAHVAYSSQDFIRDKKHEMAREK